MEVFLAVDVTVEARYMGDVEVDPDWKLKLRHGKLKTPFCHYTVIAEVRVGQFMEGYSCPPGSAFIAMCMWAESVDDAAQMMGTFGDRIGFLVTGRMQIYDSEPAQPPRDIPYGYGIDFQPIDPDAS